MSIELFHLVQGWLALDVVAALWLAYAAHAAPILPG